MRLIAAVKAALGSWFEAERESLAVWLPVFMGAGVAGYYSLRFEPPAWLGAAIAAPAVGIAVEVPSLRCLFAPVAAAALGLAAAQFATARAPPVQVDLPSRATLVTGTVQSVETLPEGRRISIWPAWLGNASTPLRRSVRVRLQKRDDGALQTGDTVRVRALVRPPAPPSYPGGWDLQRDAFYAGLGASGFALSSAERLAQGTPSAPMRLVQRLREEIAGRVAAVLPGAPGAIATTLLTGDSLSIPEPDHAAFRDSGLAHLLAVAGLHIGIVMGFALMLARLGFALSERASLFWPARQLAALCALAAGAAYMVLTGMHVPIIRSFVMACLFTAALVADRRPFSLRGLGLAGAVLMLIAPQEVPDVSFQMSFSAVLALISGYEALRPVLRRLHGQRWHQRLIAHLVALALTSLLAGSASALYGAYHFGHLQTYFVLANMAAVPLTAFWVMPAGLLALLLMPVHLEAFLLVPMGWGVRAILWVAHATSALPGATLAVPHLPIWGLCSFTIGLAWLGLWRTRWRLLGVALMLGSLAAPLLLRPADLLVSNDGRLIALRTPDTAFLQQASGGSKFTREAWAQYWAVRSFQTFPAPEDAAPTAIRSGLPDDAAREAGEPPGDADPIAAGIRCEPGACLLRPYPDRPGALLARHSQTTSFCSQASVIVSAEPARGLCPRPFPRLVDRFTVWRSGSVAIWLDRNGARIVTDRSERGDRPWVLLPPRLRRDSAPNLPPAAVDRDAQPGRTRDVPAPEATNGE